MARRVVCVGAAAVMLTVVGWTALAPIALAKPSSKLSYQGGPVLHSSRPFLIFWTPPPESIPVGSQALMERYFSDVAADSGKASNVYGVLRQYHDGIGFADYRQTFDPAHQVLTDPQPYPSRDAQCPEISSFYPTCISDQQIQSELQRLITADHLPSAGSAKAAFPTGSGPPVRLAANAPIYFVILPADVEVCWTSGGRCSGNQACGYHGNFVDAAGDEVLYAPMPLQPLRAGSLLFPAPKGVCQLDGTSVVQALDGDVNADGVINGLSHEDSEAITDPTGQNGWINTNTRNEIGDNCESGESANVPNGFGTNPNAYLPVLGGSEAAGTLFTQLINGHPYYLQSEWSNGDNNCEMRPAPGMITPRLRLPRWRLAAGVSLSFTPAKSTSRNALSSATWNFGDGSPTSFFFGKSTLTLAKHRYRKAGRYTVTLTLVDDRGNLKSTTRQLTIHTR